MAIRLIIFFVIIALIELYAFQAVKTFTIVRWVLNSYLIVSFAVIIFIGYEFTTFDRSVGQTKMTMITLGILLLTLVPKILITIVLLLEDIFRLFSASISKFSGATQDSFLRDDFWKVQL